MSKKTPAEPETVVEETEPVAVEETTEPEKPNDEEIKEDTKEDVEAEDEDNEEMSVVPEIKDGPIFGPFCLFSRLRRFLEVISGAG